MMKRQAVSAHDGSPTYMFFEDFKGYHFRSLSSMYSEPTVFQKRNKHNLLTDFKNEYLGYTKNFELINIIENNPEKISLFLPKRALLAFDEWRKIISNIKR